VSFIAFMKYTQKNDQGTVNSTLNRLTKLAINENYFFFRLNPPSSQIFLDVTELKRKDVPRDASQQVNQGRSNKPMGFV